MLSEIKPQVEEIADRLGEMREYLDIAGKERRVAELEEVASRPDFWNDRDQAQRVLQEMSSLKGSVDRVRGLERRVEDLKTLLQLGIEEGDESLEPEIRQDLRDLAKEVDALELSSLLKGEYDGNNAILTIHPGAGGTESQDWADMLLRMYLRWAERRGYKTQIVDLLPGDEAGIKSVTVVVSGENAYGYLKAEKGIHRLVRISPFDANSRRHTSFASVEVIPEIDDNIEIDINPEDLRIDTYRAGGHGGQYVNKTDSAVRITHIPTGIVVQCQNERSQYSNRLTAMKLLRARLFELHQQEQNKKLSEIRGEQREIAWGNQIRSYVFHPYSMVKDHRTGLEKGNAQAVMDGEIDEFIDAFLRGRKNVGTEFRASEAGS
ncbi:MAG: peptide chain release factor 2 [Firmicutes bacterium]|nr:peptide chain release factor 2 [Bacillota bacterium]